MATASTGRKPRPLSPHLSIWRWGWAMAASILHRITGEGAAFVGLATLLCWLGALAGGPVAYAKFADLAVTIPGRVILVGLSWSFFSHMATGLRHLVLDTGAGYELKENAIWSVLSILTGIVLTAAFWAAILLR